MQRSDDIGKIVVKLILNYQVHSFCDISLTCNCTKDMCVKRRRVRCYETEWAINDVVCCIRKLVT